MKQFLLVVLCSIAVPVISAQTSEPTPSSAPETSDENVPREYQGFAPDSGHAGVIDDPDGYVNVRARPDLSRRSSRR